MAEERLFRDVKLTSRDVEVRRIAARDLWDVLKAGLDDFNARPSFGFFLVVIYPLFALLLTWFGVRGDVWQLAFPTVAGMTLLGPVVSVALFEMSRRRERGLDLSWRSAFDFVHSSTFAPIAALSLLMMVLYVAWLVLAQYIYLGSMGARSPASVAEFMDALLTTRGGTALLIYGNAVGLIFAFAALACSVFAFPLLLDKPASLVTAIGVSTRAVTANLFVMALWGLIVVVLLAVGAALFLVGLAAVLPILAHATWHLYRKVVRTEATPTALRPEPPAGGLP